LAVLAVTVADYIDTSLALLGVGKLLEKKRVRNMLSVVSTVILVAFGSVLVSSTARASANSTSQLRGQAIYFSSFFSAFALTISSLLTIVSWTSIFATWAIEKSYTRRQLVLFGYAAGLSTLAFLGLAVVALTYARASIPAIVIRVLNAAVGLIHVMYGILRFTKTRATKTQTVAILNIDRC
jgi:hypothetical protein